MHSFLASKLGLNLIRDSTIFVRTSLLLLLSFNCSINGSTVFFLFRFPNIAIIYNLITSLLPLSFNSSNNGSNGLPPIIIIPKDFKIFNLTASLLLFLSFNCFINSILNLSALISSNSDIFIPPNAPIMAILTSSLFLASSLFKLSFNSSINESIMFSFLVKLNLLDSYTFAVIILNLDTIAILTLSLFFLSFNCSINISTIFSLLILPTSSINAFMIAILNLSLLLLSFNCSMTASTALSIPVVTKSSIAEIFTLSALFLLSITLIKARTSGSNSESSINLISLDIAFLAGLLIDSSSSR